MLRRCLIEDKEHILIPVDIETYLDVDDNWFWNKLRTSENEWARRMFSKSLQDDTGRKIAEAGRESRQNGKATRCRRHRLHHHKLRAPDIQVLSLHGKMVRVYPIYVRVKTSPKRALTVSFKILRII